MARSAAKNLRTRVNAALRDGFAERGWTTRSIGYSVDVPPPGWVEPPLQVSWSRDVAPGKWGGIYLDGRAYLEAPTVTAVAAGLPPGCLDDLALDAREEEGRHFLAALATIGRDDLDPEELTAAQEDTVDDQVGRYFAILDGPLKDWVQTRGTTRRLLKVQTAVGATESTQLDLARNMAVLALQENMPETARELMAGFAASMAHRPEYLAFSGIEAFERELSRLFPSYGSPQLT